MKLSEINWCLVSSNTTVLYNESADYVDFILKDSLRQINTPKWKYEGVCVQGDSKESGVKWGYDWVVIEKVLH